MKILVGIAIALFSIAYPLLIFFSVGRVDLRFFVVLFLVAGIARFVIAEKKWNKANLVALSLLGIYCVAILLTQREIFLRLYPVFMSIGVAILFAASLLGDSSLIEDISRRMGKKITEKAKRYTRKLTMIWTLFLTANGMIALYLALFASLSSWTLYCGLISYVLIGLLFVGEYIFRQYYIRRYGE